MISILYSNVVGKFVHQNFNKTYRVQILEEESPPIIDISLSPVETLPEPFQVKANHFIIDVQSHIIERWVTE